MICNMHQSHKKKKKKKTFQIAITCPNMCDPQNGGCSRILRYRVVKTLLILVTSLLTVLWEWLSLPSQVEPGGGGNSHIRVILVCATLMSPFHAPPPLQRPTFLHHKSHSSFNAYNVWYVMLMPHALLCDWSQLYPSNQCCCRVVTKIWDLVPPSLQTFWQLCMTH